MMDVNEANEYWAKEAAKDQEQDQHLASIIQKRYPTAKVDAVNQRITTTDGKVYQYDLEVRHFYIYELFFNGDFPSHRSQKPVRKIKHNL